MSGGAEALWWAGDAVVVAVILPALVVLAVRIIRALRVIGYAAADIRSSVATVARGVPGAMASLSDVAARCERLADRVPA
ncbi:MAG: hypothetical protein ABR511_02940 [Acidimicrobiales bacterium]